MPCQSSDTITSLSGPEGSVAEIARGLSVKGNDAANTKAKSGDQKNPRTCQLSRRVHFKSRLGCLNCKRRRIKCNELRPSCLPCRRLGLSCSYLLEQTPVGSPRTISSPLTLDDLQFYHRFLTRAFPTLPLRGDELWAKCASMSYQSECLAHAVLGLGASHLTQHGNIDYSSEALTHRVNAIKLVKQQFAKPPEDQDGADALLAALLCLCAQTSLLPDAMNEYLSMTRAGALVWAIVMPRHPKSLFLVFTSEIHDETVKEMAGKNSEDFTDANNCWASAEKLKVLCEKPYQASYQKAVTDTVLGVYESSQRGWKAHADLWRMHCFLRDDDFQDFIDPENYVSQLLAIHMLLLDFVLGPLCALPTQTIKFSARQGIIVLWARSLLKRLPQEYQAYGDWVSRFCDDLDRGTKQYLLTP